MSDITPLGPGVEFDVIRELIARWGSRAVGLGDDAAIVRPPRGDAIVVSVDTAVEGKHFRKEWLTPREISYRAVTAALSDLAAMAARPVGVLLAMTVPSAWRDSLAEIADGVADAVDAANTCIRGGNLSDGDSLSITTTVLGSAFDPVTRAGARAGDRVYVTGRLGAPAAALRLLVEGRAPGSYRERFARPVARIREAAWLVDRGISSAIDISDGLVADLGHVAAASNCSIELDATRVPVFGDLQVDDVLASGEEYELIVTTPNDLDVAAFASRFGIPLTFIGGVDTAAGSHRIVIKGSRVAAARGYDHFSS